MKKYLPLTLLLLVIYHQSNAQFHTLKIPHPSVHVTETQEIGVTDITIDYSSPKTNGRDVWTGSGVIPQGGNPIAWRAGANMNTTITFSTDVQIEGQALSAGKYGFHIIPEGDKYTLLFAHANDQWGSYYLDQDKDITLKVEVGYEECSFSEKLDYEFISKNDSTVTIGLEWADKRIPFDVSVNLRETVVASFRSQLRGINTYHWQAWNDAATWCYNRDYNLEEALTWATRSIEGGYGGFAADKNAHNMLTKIRLLKKLGRTEEYNQTTDELLEIHYTANQSNYILGFLLREQEYDKALLFAEGALDQYADVWYVQLNLGVSHYFKGNTKKALKLLEKAKGMVPDMQKGKVDYVIREVEKGTFSL